MRISWFREGERGDERAIGVVEREGGMGREGKERRVLAREGSEALRAEARKDKGGGGGCPWGASYVGPEGERTEVVRNRGVGRGGEREEEGRTRR